MEQITFDKILEIGFPEARIISNDEDINKYYNPYLDRNYYSYIIIIENRSYSLRIIEIKECLGIKNGIISYLTLPNNEIIFAMNKKSMIKLLFEKLR